MSDRADIFGPAYLEVTLGRDQLTDRLRQGCLGLCDIGAGYLADAKTVLGRLELLAEDRHIVAVNLEQGLIAHDVEMGLGNSLEHRSLDRQGLRPRRLHEVDRLTGLRCRTSATVDLLCRRGGERVWSGLSMAGTDRGLRRCGRIARLAGEVDRWAPISQRLRNLLVGCSQQGALGEDLWI